MDEDQADLQWYGAMVGASQVFSDTGMVSMLCPTLAGKSLAELTPEEFSQLMQAAETFQFSRIPEEEED